MRAFRFYGRAGWRRVAPAAAALAIAGCGGQARLPAASLVLDFTPNAVHAGIYSALAHRLDRSAGVRLHVIVPSSSTDSVKLLEAGRADFAVLDIHDLAIARQRGARLTGIMAVVERPLAAVLAARQIRTPKELERQAVGVTGLPSDTAVLDSVIAGAGGDPRRLNPVTIGFDAVPDLLAGKVVAATGFWNDEGVALTYRRRGFHVFRVDRFGAPAYPELVLCATALTLRHRQRLARAVVAALRAGYQFTLAHPAQSTMELEARVPGLDPALLGADLHALLAAWRGRDGRVGVLDMGTLRRWALWEARFGIVRRPPDVDAAFDPRLVSPAR